MIARGEHGRGNNRKYIELAFLKIYIVFFCLQVSTEKGFTSSVCRLSAETREWSKRSSVGSERNRSFTLERLMGLIFAR